MSYDSPGPGESRVTLEYDDGRPNARFTVPRAELTGWFNGWLTEAVTEDTGFSVEADGQPWRVV
jgi:hypothetical protein